MSYLISKSVALFGCTESRFMQMDERGKVGVLDDAQVRLDNLEPWRSWERFLVVDAGQGEVALYCSIHRRFVRLRADEVDGYGGEVERNALPADWVSERFCIVDAGGGEYAFHNKHWNRFLRMRSGRVDAGGGVMDVDKLPPASEWGAERFKIVAQQESQNPCPSEESIFPPDYVVLSKILEGYWGETYKVESKTDRGVYCMKRFKSHALLENKVVVQREMETLRSLPRHRNLMSYNHSTCFKDTYFTICEYIRGEQFVEEMPFPDGRKQFLEENLLAWTHQLLEGLMHLHSSTPTVIHRDLHLRNILIKYRAGSDTVAATIPGSVKIVDVGNAKILADRTLQNMSNVGGSQCYFSPERITGSEYNEKDDIWAVGVMLTELVSGRYVSRRSDFGSDGCLFATDGCMNARMRIVDEVSAKSICLGGIVRDILYARYASSRPSAEDLLRRHFDIPNAPRSFYCAISQEIMMDPVICCDGQSYERSHIEQWFDSGRRTSPLTGAMLGSLALLPNHALRSAIDEFRAGNHWH